MQWEYLEVGWIQDKGDWDCEFNELGKDGWELVTIVTHPDNWYIAHFKRVLEKSNLVPQYEYKKGTINLDTPVMWLRLYGHSKRVLIRLKETLGVETIGQLLALSKWDLIAVKGVNVESWTFKAICSRLMKNGFLNTVDEKHWLYEFSLSDYWAKVAQKELAVND